ncbi:MAG: polysaccharide deacetylase family protein [Gammaproteobacteria bacterium]|nr:polysaccharide deacetylase family protein [Gammaproteobacteria bacterium]
MGAGTGRSADQHFQWPNGARLAVSLVVNVEEGAELNIAEGDKVAEPVDELGISFSRPVRNFGNESNYRYGIQEGAGRVLALLSTYQMPATFTAAAVALERAPQLAQAIRAAGHEVCAHGLRWQMQHAMSEEEEREFIRGAVASIQRSVGERPHGWLSRYMHSAHTRRLLVEEGFSYHMDDYSSDAPFWDGSCGRPIVVLPYALDSNDMKFWTAPALTPAQWLQYAKDTCEWLYEEGAQQPRMMSLGVHLRIIGRPGRIGAYQQFLQYLSGQREVWVATRREIAAHFATAVPYS